MASKNGKIVRHRQNLGINRSANRGANGLSRSRTSNGVIDGWRKIDARRATMDVIRSDARSSSASRNRSDDCATIP
jgi:hypothetical protein